MAFKSIAVTLYHRQPVQLIVPENKLRTTLNQTAKTNTDDNSRNHNNNQPQTMSWIQISITTENTYTEMAEDCLFSQGAQTVTLSDAADQPILEPKPGQTPVWNQAVVTGLFPASTHTETVQGAITRCMQTGFNALSISADARPAIQISHEILEDQNWTRAWMDHYQPMQFGQRLWVCPWHMEPPEPDAINLRLDPGLAFGTGTHPTTALCLRWLDSNINEQKTMLDYGCGSGILAIAARLLGLPAADCVDIDPQALQATRDNAKANQVSEQTETFLADDYLQQHANRQYDLVAANILSGPLAELAPQLASHCRSGGDIILSGILQQQAEHVRAVYSDYFKMDQPVFDEDWVLLHGIRLTYTNQHR